MTEAGDGSGPSRQRDRPDPDFGGAWFDAFMGHSPTTAFVKDEAGRLLYINATFVHAFGFEERDWYGKTDAELWPPETARTLRENDERILRTGQRETVEEIVRHADGEHVWITVKFPFRDPEGRLYLAGMGIDVTSQRRLEQVATRAAHMESIGQLAGGVAHDFNNLLTAILGSCSMAEMDQDPEVLAESLASIRLAATRGAELVQGLLMFARRQDTRPQLLDANEMLATLQHLVRGLIPANVRYTFSPAPRVGPVLVDPAHLEQVLVNLVINARDALSGGGELIVRTRRETLEPPLPPSSPLAPGSYVVIQISDTGKGIDPELLERIFDPFFTTKEFGKGAGLGLATAHGVLRQNGGDVTVDSEPGKGTTFTLWLPERSGTPVPIERTSTSRPDAGQGETILVAEDDDSVRKVVANSLEGAGYAVLDSASGEEALELAVDGHPIDLLLTDVIMPGMTGPQLAKALEELRPGTPVVYMSGYTADALARRGQSLADVALLLKPFSIEALLRSVKGALVRATHGPSRVD